LAKLSRRGTAIAKFYDSYKAVFDVVKTMLVYVPAEGQTPASGIEALKSVVLGEQFTFDGLPKAVINAEPSPIVPCEMGNLLEVSLNFSVILVIREYEPADWFEDVIKVMGEVVDVILADRTLDGKVKDCYPVGFAPGEIKFQDRLLFGGSIRFKAILWFEP
jgi:hypothetical protein